MHESILNAEIWPHWIGDCNNGNNSDNDRLADFGSDINLDNAVEDPECQVQLDVRVAPTVSGFMRPT